MIVYDRKGANLGAPCGAFEPREREQHEFESPARARMQKREENSFALL
jgi:hypothetical protein